MANIQDFNKVKNDLHVEEKANQIFEYQRSLMALVLSIIPGLGPFIDKTVEQRFDSYQTKKRQIFIDTVLSNTDIITSDMVRNEACIINIAKVIEVIDKTAHADKVVFYGNLVRNGYFDAVEQISNDNFEEYLAILKDLSYREMIYLKEFAAAAKKKDGTLVGNELSSYFQKMIDIYPKLNPQSILNRLKRTGFITDNMAWVDMDNKKSDTGTLKLGEGILYSLDSSYDDFERAVMRNLDTGKI